MSNRTYLSGLSPIGFQVMSLSNSTAIAINSTCRAARTLLVSVETNAARMRVDAAPTLTTGVLFPKDLAPVWVEGYNGTSLMKFQRTTGTSKVSIMAYKRV